MFHIKLITLHVQFLDKEKYKRNSVNIRECLVVQLIKYLG